MIAYTVGNREFECYANSSCSQVLVEVQIYEVVRPKWKLFRTKEVDSCSFYIDKFDTIEEGIREMLAKFLVEEKEKQEREAKWKDYHNS